MPTRIATDKSILTDAKCIANAFNDFFSGVVNQLASSIPAVTKSPFDYLLNAPSSSFCLFPVTQSEIEDEISNLNHNKSTGPFTVPTALLKLTKTCLSNLWRYFLIYLFLTGRFLVNLKLPV